MSKVTKDSSMFTRTACIDKNGCTVSAPGW